MTKREARLAREHKKLAQQELKSARLRAEPRDHEVRSEYAKDRPKAVRVGVNPGSIYNLTVTWSCESPDIEGAWDSGTPRAWTDECWNETILPKLSEFAKLRWHEVEAQTSDTGHRMHHPMEVASITEEAQYRLVELKHSADTIYRFRLGNLPRLWGFRIVGEFHVLWYDPKHEIYPVD
ncbi:hypothetical protein JI743_13590 [Sphingopyxis sp. DHUNG17]|uniref:hypothetical protein n=1 Tax=Sphingopyxis jiangsuensis TaxID=2871171 RepID=UPI00191FC924|nr:hypothetical protein [Sphingopyxis lutea]MBL0769838.1 hypothetical protein [Sphingopyxis lutea]